MAFLWKGLGDQTFMCIDSNSPFNITFLDRIQSFLLQPHYEFILSSKKKTTNA